MNPCKLAALLLCAAIPFATLPVPAREFPQETTASAAASASGVAAAFPEIAESDLPLDPGYRLGILDNGMRYVIRSNGTPAGQAMVQLWIDTGSVAERDDERGFAHFVEHMAFNGSTNIPEGEMIRLLEREGLAFGADTNAATGFDSTTYKLDLPRNDPALLDTALMLMRETAGELTFDPEAVEREKGVVLSERRVRDTFAMRNTIDNLGFLYPDARFSRRLPIGTIESLENADAAGLRAFWQRRYRPERAAIIVVGDFDAALVESAVREHFADWQQAADAPAADPFEFGPVSAELSGKTAIYIDPALSEKVTISRHGPSLTTPDSVEARKRRVLRHIGYAIVNRRLQRLTRIDDPPFRGAGLGTSDLFETGRTTSLAVDSGEGEWRRGLAAAQETYRRALEYGFSEAEVAEQIANLRSAVENDAAGSDTRDNASYVAGILALLGDDQVPTTPESALERFEAQVAGINPATVLAALEAELVPLDDPLIRFQGRTAPEGGAAALRDAWSDGMLAAVEPEAAAALAQFAYTDFGPPGTVVSDLTEPLLGIRTIVYANGLKLNLMPTGLERDRVLVQLNVDGGEMLETRQDPLATAMAGALVSGGLGAHTIDELQSILAGRQVGFGLASADETFRIDGATTPADLELQLQLMAALLSDAAYRPQGEIQYRRAIANAFARLNATPELALANATGGILSDGDPRFTLRPEQEYLGLTFAELRTDIADRLSNGALELALVGDFDPAHAIDLVARTLGALPPRESEFRDYSDNRDRPFTADRTSQIVYHEGAPDQALLQMTWPTTDDSDPELSLGLELLERVVRIKLTDSLREELGQTYSPGVGSSLSRVYAGYGTFDLSAAIDVDDVEPAREAMLETVRLLATEEADDDSLLRARQPLIESYDNALKTNRGWMNLVDRAQGESERIERFTRARELVASITAADLKQLAARYLVPRERVEILALPRPADTQS